MTKRNTTTRILVGVLSSLAAGTAAFVTLAYVRAGRGQQSPLLPEPVAHKLDGIVAWLDDRFGKAWVDRGMEALQSALRGTGPDKLVKVLEQLLTTEALAPTGQPAGSADDLPPDPLSIPIGEN